MNANAVMVNVPVQDVQRVNHANAIVIVPVVRKSAVVVNKLYPLSPAQ